MEKPELRNVRGVPKEQFQEIIQDLIIRFILCCPEEEHESFDRLFFQIEEAHWFYLDFYREKYPNLPALGFKQFAEVIFNDCPLLQRYKHVVHKIRSTWVQYKTSVPVCGAIILNQQMDKALLVKGIGSNASWSFPRGKINRDEPSTSCAVREVFEETGLDITNLIKEDDFIELVVNEQSVKLFLIVLDCHESELPRLMPHTKGEISEIQWLHIDNDILYNGTDKKKKRFWSVVPFVRQAKQWISKRRTQMPNSNSAKVRGAKPKPSKRSGKNSVRRGPEAEIDFQIQTPRTPQKPKLNVSKSQPIAILKRGESISPNVPSSVSSSYTPPSYATPESHSQFFAWSPSPSTPPQSYYMQTMNSPQSYPYYESTHTTSQAPTDSFLNFTFNADDIVGGLTA